MREALKLILDTIDEDQHKLEAVTTIQILTNNPMMDDICIEMRARIVDGLYHMDYLI